MRREGGREGVTSAVGFATGTRKGRGRRKKGKCPSSLWSRRRKVSSDLVIRYALHPFDTLIAVTRHVFFFNLPISISFLQLICSTRIESGSRHRSRLAVPATFLLYIISHLFPSSLTHTRPRPRPRPRPPRLSALAVGRDEKKEACYWLVAVEETGVCVNCSVCSCVCSIRLQEMERVASVVRLPPGFRFHPTDEELVVQYLKRKVFSCPLPASIIPDVNLAKFDPWDLPGGCEEERYFFSLKEAKYPNGNRSNRAARSGYWKATGKDKAIKLAAGVGQVVGMKKVLVFYQGKPPTGAKTDWVMHEYRLSDPESRACVFPQRKNSTHSCTMPSGDWVLCRIFKKKRATNMDAEAEGDETVANYKGIRFIDFMGERDRDGRRHPAACASNSSCLTELSDGCSSGEESSSMKLPLG